mgnify:CR=1 FL=1
MDVIIFIGKWLLVITVINIVSWTFFPNTMRELTKFEAEWRNYKLKKWARLKEKNVKLQTEKNEPNKPIPKEKPPDKPPNSDINGFCFGGSCLQYSATFFDVSPTFPRYC